MKILKNRIQGFTLIEVLIVIAILGILIIAAIWAWKPQLLKGRDAKRKGDLDLIRNALEQYHNDNDCYPTTLPMCNTNNGLGNYLDRIPCEPSGLSYSYYSEEGMACPQWYWIFTRLENSKDDIIASVGCQGGCGPTIGSTFYSYYVSSPNAPLPETGVFSGTHEYVFDPEYNYYGCFSGVCAQIGYYIDENGIQHEACQPNFYNDPTCDAAHSLCSEPNYECVPQQ